MGTDLPRIPWLQQLYLQYLVEQNTEEFRCGVNNRYSAAALERLLTSSASQSRRAAALALGLVADFASSAALGRALHDEDRSVRSLAEGALRAVWCRDGSTEDRRQLSLVVRLNHAGQFQTALAQACELIDNNSRLAEAWNQRAIARFALGRYLDSIHDCRRALALNPFHFGAQAGMGQCFLRLGNELWALESFRRALAIYPELDGVRNQVVALERKLRKNS